MLCEKKIRCGEEYFIFIIGFVIISECKVKGCGEKVVVYVSILIFLIYMYLYVYIIIILFIIIIFICMFR